ncbi:hypothetical protein [Aeromonas veronii]|uniref:hypothetical protein n=1 Tax=Aeromonas veronii TaxID=654 RepID=UPI00130238BD|nr:hypothetical protein [Aeromonas veronii]KAE9627743.1 hypothetical protein GO977_21980 [Aeromonas veronii]
MKRIVLATVIVALAGCTSKPLTNTDQEKLDDQVMWMSEQGKAHSVSSLKADYRQKTGQELPRPANTLQCGWDASCYYNAWQLSYDEHSRAYDAEQEAVAAANRAKQAAEQERACLVSPECRNNRDIAMAKNLAIESYRYFTSRYAMNMDEYDYLSRQMCDSAMTAQRNGAALDQVVGTIATTPGGDSADRMFAMRLAKSCWSLSGLGVSSSRDVFPNNG